MKQLKKIQDVLEHVYGAKTGLDVRHFVKLTRSPLELGKILVQENEENLNVALLFDRALLKDWKQSPRSLSVPFEEVSHFVYLCYNHHRGRNITKLEMEIQSEVDRILLAYHSDLDIAPHHREALKQELIFSPYREEASYEQARRVAANFICELSEGDPSQWQDQHFSKLRRFFHSDLSEKIHLARRAAKHVA